MTSDQSARRLWLVRHGETEGQSSIRYHGSNDVPLSAVGRAQIGAIAPLLAGVEFARVVHSPLVRAAESAHILAQLCQVPRERLVAEARLREISFGVCEGMTADEIAAAFPEFWRAHQAGMGDCFPEGELRSAFVQRVHAAAHELAAATAAGDILVVSHRGTVRQTLRALLRVPALQQDEFGVALGSVTTLRHEGDWRLEAFGLLP